MQSISDLLSDFRKARQEYEKHLSNAPRIIGSEALKVIDKNFDNESYDTGRGREKWKPRADATNKAYDRRGNYKGSVYNSKSKILQQTLNLRDGVKKKESKNSVFIGINLLKVPYAQIHNEGGVIQIPNHTRNVSKGKFARGTPSKASHRTISAHTIRMPKRQYMPKPGDPPNPAIMKASFNKLQNERNRILKKFAK